MVLVVQRNIIKFEKQAVIQKVLNTLLLKKIGSFHYFIKHLLESGRLRFEGNCSHVVRKQEDTYFQNTIFPIEVLIQHHLHAPIGAHFNRFGKNANGFASYFLLKIRNVPLPVSIHIAHQTNSVFPWLNTTENKRFGIIYLPNNNSFFIAKLNEFLEAFVFKQRNGQLQTS